MMDPLSTDKIDFITIATAGGAVDFGNLTQIGMVQHLQLHQILEQCCLVEQYHPQSIL